MATRAKPTSGAASFGASRTASRYLTSACAKSSASYAASPAASAASAADPDPRASLVVAGSGGGAAGLGAGSSEAGGFASSLLETRLPESASTGAAVGAGAAGARAGSCRSPPQPITTATIVPSAQYLTRPSPRGFGRPRRVLASVVAQHGGLALDDGREADRPLPDAHQRLQRLLRVVAAQIDPLVIVSQEELSAVLEIRIFHVDEGIARIGELKKEL